MDQKYINAMAEWSKNDPDPKKTLDLLAKKLRKQKQMVRTNPILLLKTQYPEDYKGWLGEKKRLESIYAINGGFDQEKNMKHIWCIPQVIYNIDPDYWFEITRGKQYTAHPYFLVSNPFAHKNIDRSL